MADDAIYTVELKVDDKTAVAEAQASGKRLAQAVQQGFGTVNLAAPAGGGSAGAAGAAGAAGTGPAAALSSPAALAATAAAGKQHAQVFVQGAAAHAAAGAGAVAHPVQQAFSNIKLPPLKFGEDIAKGAEVGKKGLETLKVAAEGALGVLATGSINVAISGIQNLSQSVEGLAASLGTVGGVIGGVLAGVTALGLGAAGVGAEMLKLTEETGDEILQLNSMAKSAGLSIAQFKDLEIAAKNAGITQNQLAAIFKNASTAIQNEWTAISAAVRDSADQQQSAMIAVGESLRNLQKGYVESGEAADKLTEAQLKLNEAIRAQGSAQEKIAGAARTTEEKEIDYRLKKIQFAKDEADVQRKYGVVPPEEVALRLRREKLELQDIGQAVTEAQRQQVNVEQGAFPREAIAQRGAQRAAEVAKIDVTGVNDQLSSLEIAARKAANALADMRFGDVGQIINALKGHDESFLKFVTDPKLHEAAVAMSGGTVAGLWEALSQLVRQVPTNQPLPLSLQNLIRATFPSRTVLPETLADTMRAHPMFAGVPSAIAQQFQRNVEADLPVARAVKAQAAEAADAALDLRVKVMTDMSGTLQKVMQDFIDTLKSPEAETAMKTVVSGISASLDLLKGTFGVLETSGKWAAVALDRVAIAADKLASPAVRAQMAADPQLQALHAQVAPLREQAAAVRAQLTPPPGIWGGAPPLKPEEKAQQDALMQQFKTISDQIRVLDDKIEQRERADVRKAGGQLIGGTATEVAKQHGGMISGPGDDASDTIPAWLSPGEYVVRAASVRRLGLSFLDQINAGHFQGGGEVDFSGGARQAFARNAEAVRRRQQILLTYMYGSADERQRETTISLMDWLDVHYDPSRMSEGDALRAFAAAKGFRFGGLARTFQEGGEVDDERRKRIQETQHRLRIGPIPGSISFEEYNRRFAEFRSSDSPGFKFLRTEERPVAVRPSEEQMRRRAAAPDPFEADYLGLTRRDPDEKPAPDLAIPFESLPLVHEHHRPMAAHHRRRRRHHRSESDESMWNPFRAIGGFVDAERFQSGGLVGGYLGQPGGYLGQGQLAERVSGAYTGRSPYQSFADIIGREAQMGAVRLSNQARSAGFGSTISYSGAGLDASALPPGVPAEGGAISQHTLDLITSGGQFQVFANMDTIESIRSSAIGSKLTSTGAKPSWY